MSNEAVKRALIEWPSPWEFTGASDIDDANGNCVAIVSAGWLDHGDLSDLVTLIVEAVNAYESLKAENALLREGLVSLVNDARAGAQGRHG